MADSKRARQLGHLYAKEILKHDDEAKKYAFKGSGFFDAFKKGFSSVVKILPKAVATVGAITGQPEVVAPALVADKVLNGSGVMFHQTDNRSRLMNFITEHKKSGGSKRSKRVLSEKQKRRNALVKKVMKETGLSLPKASKYIKEHNMQY